MLDDQISTNVEPSSRQDMATRQLCVGAYLDQALRDEMLKHVLLDPHHRVAPSYGFNIVPVVVHAKRALILDMAVRVWLGSVILVTWLVNWRICVAVCCVLAFLQAARHVARTAPQAARLRAKDLLYRTLRRVRLKRDTRDRLQIDRELQLASETCLAAFIVLLALAKQRHWTWSAMLRSLLLPLFLLAVGTLVGAVLRRWSANNVFGTKDLGVGKLGRRVAHIDKQQGSEYTVYRRPYIKLGSEEEDGVVSPFLDLDDLPAYFVGAGELVHRWLPPLIVPLIKAEGDPERAAGTNLQNGKARNKQEFEKPPFQIIELIDELKSALDEVGNWHETGALPNLNIRDRIYVEEMDLSNNRDCLRGPLTSDWLESIFHDPFGDYHHFIEISTTATGEVVTTVFLRVTLKARSLNLDFATCALTRLPSEYAMPGRFGEGGWGSMIREGLVAVWNLPQEVASLTRLVILPKLFLHWLWARYDWTVLPRRGSAIATVYSVRQGRAASWYDARHDRPEILGQMKIIEQRLLRTVKRFLESKGVDTSEFEKRAQTIISANVLNMGGRMDINHSSVGPNASVNSNVSASPTARNLQPATEIEGGD